MRGSGIYLSGPGWVLAVVLVLLESWAPTAIAGDVEAFVGQPLGVGRVTVDVFQGEPTLPLQDERFTVAERTGRAMYPVVKIESVRQFLRGLLGVETPRTVTLYFLFRGEEPFDLSVYSPVEQGVRVRPMHDPRGHQRLLGEWWKELGERWTRLQKDSEFPPVAENFLIASFARRLNRPLPEVKVGLFQLKKNDDALGQLFGGEASTLAIDRRLVLGEGNRAGELQPLPDAPTWKPTDLDEAALSEVPVEPLSMHVPEECFYLRFGSFPNYLWFRDLNAKWDGDFKNMVLRRAINHRAASRIEQQLSLKETALSRVLGPQFISDAALIGLDPYLDQGGAIGLLVEARNSFLLAQDFMRQRRESLAKFDDAAESTVQLAGQDVSLIATPDGRVRSYYAQAGDYHLVTTSRTMAERFLETTVGTRVLGTLPSFRRARQELTTERQDTVFVFASEKFFQNLCSPACWVEMRRRQQAEREPLMLELARLAARCEGIPAVSPEELIDMGMLPADFGQRVDGSRLESADGGPRDSLRGAPGFFVPVSDVQVTGISPQESKDYADFLDRLREQVGQLPPVAVGLQRAAVDEGAPQRLVVDVLADPLGDVKLGRLVDSLGNPVDEQLHPVEGDVVAIQAVLNLPVPLIGGEKQPHLLFAGIRDFRSPLAVRQGKVIPGAPTSELIRAYVGAWPRPGLLQILQGPEQATGGAPQPLGDQMWQAEQDKFLLISFKSEVIQQVQPQLGFEPAERPAQVRLRVDDLTDKQLADTVSALGYMRARETSVAPSRLMNSLANLLQVPRDECRTLAERLVDGNFVCPLGGEYQLVETAQSLPAWTSSALPPANRFLLTAVPEDFRLSLLEWFRGFSADLRIADGQLSAHAELNMTSDALP